MTPPRHKLLLCNCNRTMPLDGKAIGNALGLPQAPPISSELCRRHVASFEAAMKTGEDTLVTCTQEAPLFAELHGELAATAEIRFVNIRETAGWAKDARGATPKIAALIAMADLPDPEPAPAVSYQSAGQTLIIGQAADALAWAEQLGGQLSVSVLIAGEPAAAELPQVRRYPVYSGSDVEITGYLGAFNVTWRQANPIDLEVCIRCNACIAACPEGAIDYGYQVDADKCRSHRKCVAACAEVGAIDFARTETARTDRFDLILDLSATPLIRTQTLPQGYLAPGKDALARSLAAAQLAQLVGEFEKPKFFNYKESLCAHSRSGIVGCSKCVDVCSAGAISSDVANNRVVVEPHLCVGCGACSTVCPSGAMTYGYPRVADLGARVGAALKAYREAGGASPCLLFHDGEAGRKLVGDLARRGPGLPAHVIPLEVFHPAALGLDLVLGAYALGATQVAILASGSEAPQYLDALRAGLDLAEQIVDGLGYGRGHFRLVTAADRKALESSVWSGASAVPVPPAPFHLSSDKRTTLDFVFEHLLKHAPRPAPELPLRAGAPYGGIAVNTATCTLCMSCVGACPESALTDSKEAPQLRFIERNCVQCGLCEKTCPENAISLTPRLLLTPASRTPVVLNEAEPFECVRCKKAFATRQMIENMRAKLGQHSMFSSPAALQRLQMCADCRVLDMMEAGGQATIADYAAGKSPLP